MNQSQDNAPSQIILRYQVGDVVHITQGPDQGRRGMIIQVNPASARPYLVKCSDIWYVHFAEDRLAAAPGGV